MNRSMIRRAALVLALAAALPAGAGELKPQAAQPAPALAGQVLDGAALRLADYRGRVVVVNFWATWCKPCVKELPSLEALQQRLGPKAAVVLVNFQEDADTVKRFLGKVPVKLPIVLDPDGALGRPWGIIGLPTTFVVDAEGRIRYRAVGDLDWAADGVVKTLQDISAR